MKNIFQAGGALSASHSTYIKREADQDARQAVLQGDYLHVIAPRQVGKTSLLKQLAHQLKDIGWHYAYVDFSTLMDLPKTEWYRELGRELARTLTPNHSPMLTNQIQLRSYLLYTALKEQPHIILLFDEVEGVGQARDNNGQPFSDTFFSTLRNFFIQRDDYEGTLVVALAGAVNPNDLVQDPGISPFNIGQKISLDNFTAAETQTLTQHLTQLDCSLEPEVYQAIYHWTNGHPYLTQRLCAELEKGVRNGRFTTLSPAEVTAVVEQTLLNPANPLQQDSNLRHVGKMLDRLSPSAAKLWSRLQAGETVTRYEAVGDLYLELYLTGAVKADAENLIIRNQIYKQAFAPAKAQKKKQPASLNQPRSSTMTQPFRIFISSTWVDLKPEREAVEKALHRMQSTAFAGMEYFGSRPETPKQISLDGVDSSDIYIGIFAHRYGSGITEDEYRRAQAKGLPCLIYLKSDEAPVLPAHFDRDPNKFAKLTALKGDLKQNHTLSFFETPDNLATQVVTDLHNLLNQMPGVEKKETVAGPKYQINIHGGQGINIGDGQQVTQHFATPPLQTTPPAAEPPTTSTDSSFAEAIYDTLTSRFDLEELRTLCFRLGNIEYDDLRGEGRAAKARELVRRLERNKQLNHLWTTIKQMRPDIA